MVSLVAGEMFPRYNVLIPHICLFFHNYRYFIPTHLRGLTNLTCLRLRQEPTQNVVPLQLYSVLNNFSVGRSSKCVNTNQTNYFHTCISTDHSVAWISITLRVINPRKIKDMISISLKQTKCLRRTDSCQAISYQNRSRDFDKLDCHGKLLIE